MGVRKSIFAVEAIKKDAKALRLFEQERAILEVTELMCKLMEVRDISRSQLAHRLGKTKGYVSQVLNGSRNMTVRTMSDFFLALGYSVHFSESDLRGTIDHPLKLVPSTSTTPRRPGTGNRRKSAWK